MKKINLIKVILKLECLVYQNMYFIFVEPFRLKQIQKVYTYKRIIRN